MKCLQVEKTLTPGEDKIDAFGCRSQFRPKIQLVKPGNATSTCHRPTYGTVLGPIAQLEASQITDIL